MTEFKASKWALGRSDVLSPEDDTTILVEQYEEALTEGIRAYGAVAVMNHSMARLAYVLQHPKARLQWVSKLSDQIVIEGNDLGKEHLFFERYKLIWPFSDREYVLRGEWEFDLNSLLPMAKWSVSSVNNLELPEKSSGVRGELHELEYTLTQINQLQTEVTVKIKVDPKGWLPDAIKNQIQKTWCLKTLRAVNSFAGVGNEKHSLMLIKE